MCWCIVPRSNTSKLQRKKKNLAYCKWDPGGNHSSNSSNSRNVRPSVKWTPSPSSSKCSSKTSPHFQVNNSKTQKGVENRSPFKKFQGSNYTCITLIHLFVFVGQVFWNISLQIDPSTKVTLFNYSQTQTLHYVRTNHSQFSYLNHNLWSSPHFNQKKRSILFHQLFLIGCHQHHCSFCTFPATANVEFIDPQTSQGWNGMCHHSLPSDGDESLQLRTGDGPGQW